jgi:hypothetical protein
MKMVFVAVAIVGLFSNSVFAQNDDVEFRKILTGFLSDRYMPEEMAQIIYATPQALMVAPRVKTPQDFITAIDQIGRTTQPQTLFDKSLANPVVGYDVSEMESTLHRKPLTVFVFPGIFSEFITNRAFEEVFQKADSSAAVEFKKKISSLQSSVCLNGAVDTCDYSYDLPALTIADGTDMRTKFERLDRYLDVASIDDANKQPLVRVVLFHTDGMSLETLGTSRENSIRFTRRLEKYFRLMGTPENMAFIGYSRGTMVALDTLAYNYSLNKPWVKNVKGMISLGGVNYGTALADDAFNPKSINGKLIIALQSLLASLKNYDDKTLQDEGIVSPLTKATVIAQRATENLTNIKNFLAFAGSSSNKDIFETAEGLKEQAKGTDVKSSLRLMVSQIQNLGALAANGGNVTDFITLEHRRIIKLCDSVLDAVREMQTSQRLKWWATNDVPLTTRYYAVSGTMGAGLVTHEKAFNPDSADDRMLVGDYNDYLNSSGVLLNDSQVAIERVRFWPELSAMLNPHNAGMKSEFLGVVGTHHWGLALAIVNVNSNGKVNPFPRVDLIKSLATKISSDLVRDDATTVVPK